MNQPGRAGDNQASPAGAEGSAAQASSLAVSDGEPGVSAKPSGVAAAGPRAWAARWARSPAGRQIAILIGFLAAGVLFTWPRASYLWEHKLPGTRDAAGFVWGFWWVARSVVHLSNPWSTHYIAAPVGTQLGFHTLMPLPGLVMTPVTLAFGPSASYNLLSALAPGLLAYAMYRAARLWVPSQLGAVAGGAFYGLSSMLANQSWYELNLALGALFIPLALEAAVRLRRRPGWPPAVFLGVVLGAALLTDQESAILAGIAGGLALLPWLIFDRARAPRDSAAEDTGGAGSWGAGSWGAAFLGRLRPVLLALVVFGVVGSPQIISMVQQAVAGGASFPAKSLAVSYTLYGAGLLGLISPSPRIGTYGLQGQASFFYQHGIIDSAQSLTSSLAASYVPMFGVTLTVMAVAGLLVSFRRRHAWLLALFAVGCASLALGPALWVGSREYVPFAQNWDGVRLSLLMPYTWLVHTPGLSNFREAYRFAELALAAGALLAGAAVQWLRTRAAKPVLAVVLVLCLVELGWSGNPPGQVMPAGLRIQAMGTSYPKIDGAIAADPSSSIVVDFPFGIRGGPPIWGPGFNPQAQVMAAADGHPLANGLISRVPAATLTGIEHEPFYAGLVTYVWHDPGVADHAASFPRAARNARQMNVGWVIVWPTHVNGAIARYLRLTGFKVAYRVRDVIVYHR
ncbi:MAG TPA: hypothetical protein VHY58_09125 [Streptosporangiaceae bacterium]|jgi:hypothetical protein|nr:hypothetical protein [Streptosporangiaceae bacterium]